MTYSLELFDDGWRITDPDGDEIYRRGGEEGWNQQELAQAILEDANFGTPQKEALLAAFGMVDKTRTTDTLSQR